MALFLLLLFVDKVGLFRERSRILTASAFKYYASKSEVGALHLRNSEMSRPTEDVRDIEGASSRFSWHTKKFDAFPAEFYTYLE